MSTQLSDTILEVGIDYITATSHSRHSSGALYSFGRWLVAEEVSSGCKNCDWRASGYRGFRAGGTCTGLSQQGTIVRASGVCAREYWQQLLHFADNITRLDVQVTAFTEGGPTARLRKHHVEARRATKRRGRPAAFRVWYGPSGPETITLGKRCSDRFGRVYDKGLESGLEEYKGALRYEVELHRHQALQTALYLDSQEHDQQHMLALVSKFMTVRGLKHGLAGSISPAIADCDYVRLQKSECATTDGRIPLEVRRALTWMSVCVRPSVSRLSAAGLRGAVIAALDLDHEG